MPGAKNQRAQRGAASHHAGLSAEASIERHYERRGIPIRARRWRGAAGEIDLIAQDGDALVFIEVKKSRSFARAAERLRPRQIERLMGAAEEYVGEQPSGSLTEMRFDIALVDASGAINVLEDALI